MTLSLQLKQGTQLFRPAIVAPSRRAFSCPLRGLSSRRSVAPAAVADESSETEDNQVFMLTLPPEECLSTIALAQQREASGAPTKGVIVKATAGNGRAAHEAFPGDRVLAIDADSDGTAASSGWTRLERSSANELREILRSRRDKGVEAVSLLLEKSAAQRSWHIQDAQDDNDVDEAPKSSDAGNGPNAAIDERVRRRMANRNRYLERYVSFPTEVHSLFPV